MTRTNFTFLLPALALALLPGCAQTETADLLFLGGTVLTVDADNSVAEALAVKDGMILAVGTEAAVAKSRGPQTEVVDLAGKTVLPGFIDAHGHISILATLSAFKNLAPPPVGPVEDIAGLQEAVREHAQDQPEAPWILGFGYDDSLLAERRHPNRADLDQVSSDRPIALLHVSGHLLACNSKALALAGIESSTENPPGGVIRRSTDSGEPDGVLEETAMGLILGRLPTAETEQGLDLLDQAQRTYAGHGITTAQEGAAGPADMNLLSEAADRGRLAIDVAAYPRVATLDSVDLSGQPFGEYRNRLKVGGVKLTLDGSPQGKTAFLSQPYEVPPEGRGPDYRGYPTLPDERVNELVARFLKEGTPMLAHANGDAAADQLIAAVRRGLEARGDAEVPDHRTVMIHAQTLRHDQLDPVRELGITPSFFVAHTYFWGDWHRDSVLGRERAYRISPAQTAKQRGVRFSFHNDAPIVPPDVLRLIWTGVNRRTRSNDILGEEERVSVIDAIRAVTIDAAYQAFEEDRKGSLEPGKLADLVVLSENPLEVAPEDLAEIQVLTTYKEGHVVFRRGD